MFQGKILVVDDQPAAAQASVSMISNFVPETSICCASSAAEAISILESETLSLVFLDIDMPDTSGFSLAGYIDGHIKGLKYVFLTGHSDFAARSYDYEPLDFLTKPIDLVRLKRTFERLKESGSSVNLGKVAICTETGLVLLVPQEIVYVEKQKRKTMIHLGEGVVYPTDYPLDELEVIFGSDGLFRCHQSHLVSLNAIERLRSAQFGQTYEAVLTDGAVIPVSRAKYSKLKEELSRLGVRFM